MLRKQSFDSSNNSKAKSESEINEYRQKTISRLVDKRREYQTLQSQDIEQQKIQSSAFRTEWRRNHKETINNRILDKVDNRILKEAIRKNPEIILRMKQKLTVEVPPFFDNPLEGLTLDTENIKLISSTKNTVNSLFNDSSPRSAAPTPLAVGDPVRGLTTAFSNMSPAATQFLQNAVTFDMSVNGRINKKSSGRDNATDSRTGSSNVLQNKSSDSATTRPKLPRSLSASSLPKQGPASGFSSYDSASQANELIWSLVHGVRQQKSQSTSSNVNSAKAVDDSVMSATVRTVGLMSRFMPHTSEGRDEWNSSRRRGSQQPNGTFDPNASFMSPMHRTKSFISNYTGGKTPGNLLHTVSSTNMSITDEPARGGDKSALLASLVDSVFLIGPSKQTIYEHVKLMSSPSVRGSFSSTHGADSPSAATRRGSGEGGNVLTNAVIHRTVDPSILFMTHCDNPAEMLSLLPQYCFPSGAELSILSTVQNASSTKSQQKAALMRKNSSLVSPTVLPQTSTAKANGKKLLRPFFPSDFSISAAAAAAATGIASTATGGGHIHNVETATQATAPTATTATSTAADGKPLKSCFPTSHAPPAVAIAPKSPFILMFGDHTYQQYCLGLQLPVQFYDPRTEVVIHSSYVVCLMTKLPLFCYLFHLLELFETVHQGFKFMEPLSLHEEHYPTPAELRPLNDLAAKLKRITAPLYPFLYSSSGDGFSSVTNVLITSDTQLVNCDYNCILPDIEFLLNSRVASTAKIELPFKRRSYQTFYSSKAAQFDPSDNISAERMMNHFNRQIANTPFVPNAVHKSEREREDTYMTLMWALPVLLRCLPLDQIILALGCAVTEMRIVVKHKDFHVISGVILALIALLKPLRWCSPVIVILPDSLSEFVESPVPILIGLQNLPPNFELMERFVVLDPQERIVHLNPTDVVVAHTILLPHASKLVNVLRAPTETILRLTRKKKSAKPKKVVYIQQQQQQQQSSYNLNLSEDDGKKSPSPALPDDAAGGRNASPVDPASTYPPANAAPSVALPIELDVNSADSLQLLGAVKTFSSLVASHIEAIINTAIQVQHEERQTAKTKRRQLSTAPGVAARNRPMSLDTGRKVVAESQSQPVAAISAAQPNSAEKKGAEEAIALVPPTAEHRPSVSMVNLHSGSPLPNAQITPSVTPKKSQNSPTRSSLSMFPSDLSPMTPGTARDTSATQHADAKPSDSGTPKKPSGGGLRHSLPNDKKAAISSKMLKQTDHPGKPVAHPQKKSTTNITPTKVSDVHAKQEPNSRSPVKDRGSTSPNRRASSHVPPRHSISPMIEASRVSKVLSAYETTKRRNGTSSGGGSGGSPPRRRQSLSKDSSPADTTPLQGKSLSTELGRTPPEEGIVPTPPVSSTAIVAAAADHVNVAPQAKTEPLLAPLGEDSNQRPVTHTLSLSIPQPSVAAALRAESADEYSETTFNDTLEPSNVSPSVEAIPVSGRSHRSKASSGSGGSDKSSGASVSSNASSLPSLQLNAPLMSVKEIGQGGAKFIAQLLETQMFCNYCQNLKVQSAAEAAAKDNAADSQSETPSTEQIPSGIAARDPNSVLSPASSDPSNIMSPTNASGKVRNRSRTQSVSQMKTETEPNELYAHEDLDALSSVFEVMLTGTKVMDSTTITRLVGEYRTTYGAPAFGPATVTAGASLLAGYASIMDKVGKMPLDISAYAREYLRENVTVAESAPAGMEKGPEGEATTIDGSAAPLDSALVWCNGLSCRGMCNTASCTDICLQLWEKRVQKLRQQTVLQNIVNKHHHSALVMKSHFIRVTPSGEAAVAVKSPDKKKAKSADVIVKVNLKPKCEAIRHGRETESQYLQRQAIIRSSIDAALQVAPPASLTKKVVEKSDKPVTVRGPVVTSAVSKIVAHTGTEPTKKKRKKMVYARSSTADPATMLIAKYYAAKQEKILARRRKRALRIVKRFLLTYVVYYRKIRFISSIVHIQSFTRGYIIRYHIAAIVEALISRKIERLLACIRIRTFLRFHAKSIARRWAKRQADEMRRKRSIISIPVAAPGANKMTRHPSTVSVSNVKGSPSAVSANLRKSIRDGDIKESAGSLVNALYAPRPVGGNAPSPISAARKSLPVGGASPASPDIGDLARSKSVTGAKPTSPSALSTLFEQVEDVSDTGSAHGGYAYDTSLIDKLNANYDATASKRLSLNAHQERQKLEGSVASAQGGHEKNKKFGSRTYSEKAKEFLQFGKILHRSISSTSNAGAARRSTMYNFKPSAPNVRDSPDSSTHKSNSAPLAAEFAPLNEAHSQYAELPPLEVKPVSAFVPPSSHAQQSSKLVSKQQSNHSLDEIEGYTGRKHSSYVNSGVDLDAAREMALSPTSGIPTFTCEYDSSSGDEEVEAYDSVKAFGRRSSEGSVKMRSKSLSSATGGQLRNRYNSNYISGDTGKFASRYLELNVSREDEDDEKQLNTVDRVEYAAEIAAALLSDSAASDDGRDDEEDKDGHEQVGVLTVAALQQRDRDAPTTPLPVQLQREIIGDAVNTPPLSARSSQPSNPQDDPLHSPRDARASFARSGQMRSVGSIVFSVKSGNSSSGGETTPRIVDNIPFSNSTPAVQAPLPIEAKRRGSGTSIALPQPIPDHKKMSPIGRYAASNNYDISKIVSSGTHIERTNSTLGNHLPHLPRPPGGTFPSPKDKALPAAMSNLTPPKKESIAIETDHIISSAPSFSPFSGGKERTDKTSLSVSSRASSRASTPDNSVPANKEPFVKPPLSIRVSINSDISSPTPLASAEKVSVGGSADSSAGQSKHHSLGSRSSGISSSSSERDEDEAEEEDEEEVCEDNLTEALKTIPLRTLGSSVQDCLNRQQLQTIKTMWSHLRAGIEILKHGRSGKPKFKTLLCDVDMTKLYWRGPGSRPDPDLDESDIEVDSLYPGSIVPRSGVHSGALFAASGAPAGKGKRTGSMAGRRSSIVKTNAERVIHFNEITEVHDDCSTEVMKRSLHKQYVSGNTCVISVVLADSRSLDFEIQQDIWGPLYRGLQILVTYYQGILPSRGRSNSTLSMVLPKDTVQLHRGGSAASDSSGGSGMKSVTPASAAQSKPTKTAESKGIPGASSFVYYTGGDEVDTTSPGYTTGIAASAAVESSPPSYIARNKMAFPSIHAKKKKEHGPLSESED